MGRAKVQEITPVYTVVQPATVPLRPAKPNKIMIGFIFLVGVGCVGWILFVKDFVKWNGRTKEVIVPLFSGCLFVTGDVAKMDAFISSQKAAFLVDKEGKSLSIEADKTELLAKFAQLLR